MTKRSPANPAPARRSGTRLAVFCSGFGSNFQAIIDAVKKKKLNAHIALMVCDKPGAYAVTRAHKAGIPVVLIQPGHFTSCGDYERILVSILKSQNVDWIVLAGFMRIFSPVFVHAFKKRIVNIHPSYLPAFKGAHAIRDAFQAGVKETGVTVHLVTEKVDAGPILYQQKIDILKNETLKSLEAKIHKIEHRVYPKAIQETICHSERSRGIKSSSC
ncbi:MAG: phosphoribosylglycinamide formyltransferase [Candidatus Omnitrophica bacterium]|nr:phosphoribosylglycinamide formyltransferase [Candidatus Omnitrophota bacterium]